MKQRTSIWYYISIAGIALSLGAMSYGIATGQTAVLGKFVILLVISIYFFARERRQRQHGDSQGMGRS